MNQEGAQVVHELAAETRKLLAKQPPLPREVSTEDREKLRADLASWGEHFAKEYGYTPSDSRRFIREMLTVSV